MSRYGFSKITQIFFERMSKARGHLLDNEIVAISKYALKSVGTKVSIGF